MHHSILFIVTEDWYFISHRLSLALAAKQNGYQVSVACNDTGKINEIKGYGFECYKLKIERGFSSPLTFLRGIKEIGSLIKKVNPSILHSVSLQPIILSLLATIFNRKIIKILAVTGLGSLFLSNTLKFKIVRLILTFFLGLSFQRKKISIIVQNKDDESFVRKNLRCPKKKIFIIRGSGINLKHHTVQKEPKYPPIVVAFVGRLLEDKGIKTLLEAFKIVNTRNLNIKLMIVGSLDYNNPSSISKKYLESVIVNVQNINYLGEVEDIREVWEKAHIAILPSKREGLPKSLLEAASAGRPIIATDVPGCREIAINKINAITIPLNDVKKLSEAIILLSENNELRKMYGLRSRKLVESDMSEEIVIQKTLSIYENLIIYR